VVTKVFFQPQSIEEATELLSNHGDLLVMAGGTLAMPLINERVSVPEKVMGLKSAGMSYVRKEGNTIFIGACTTFTEFLDQNDNEFLHEAASKIGGWPIRNMATIGGNLFAPSPSGDFAVAMIALDAKVKLVSKKGSRIVPVADFYTGFLSNILQTDELVVEIQVPVPKGKTVFSKYGRRENNTGGIVTVAAQVTFNNNTVQDARIVLGAVDEHPIRITKAEDVLKGTCLDDATIEKAAMIASQECHPDTDGLATATYRQKMVKVFVKRVLLKITGKEE